MSIVLQNTFYLLAILLMLLGVVLVVLGIIFVLILIHTVRQLKRNITTTTSELSAKVSNTTGLLGLASLTASFLFKKVKDKIIKKK